MRLKSLLLLSSLFVLNACGGGHDDAEIDLSGTWYYKRGGGAQPSYYGRHVIEQRGQEVLITYCDRQKLALRLAGSALMTSQGGRFYLQPAGSSLLRGPDDRGGASEVRKFSSGTGFDAGRVSVTAGSTEPVSADREICAATREFGFQRADGTPLAGKGVSISAPYKNSFVRIELAFEAVAEGEYSASESAEFVRSPAGKAFVEVTSPEYVGPLGTDGLIASSGTVRVKRIARDSFSVEGTVLVFGGTWLTFSAEVPLDEPAQ